MGKKWTNEVDSALTTMRSAGMTYQEIGAILGRSHQSCSQRAFALGITNKHAPKVAIDEPYDYENYDENYSPCSGDPTTIHLPTYVDEINGDLMAKKWRGREAEWNLPPSKRPSWWTAMMWWRK
jgi:hypothetical protein